MARIAGPLVLVVLLSAAYHAKPTVKLKKIQDGHISDTSQPDNEPNARSQRHWLVKSKSDRQVALSNEFSKPHEHGSDGRTQPRAFLLIPDLSEKIDLPTSVYKPEDHELRKEKSRGSFFLKEGDSKINKDKLTPRSDKEVESIKILRTIMGSKRSHFEVPDRELNLHARFELFRRRKERQHERLSVLYQLIRNVMFHYFKMVKHLENQKLKTRVEASISDNLINRYVHLLRRANAQLLAFILYKLNAVQGLCTNDLLSNQRMRGCLNQLALKLTDAYKKRSKRLNLLFLHKCKSFMYPCQLDSEALDHLFAIYRCALAKQGYKKTFRLAKENLRLIKAFNLSIPFKTLHTFTSSQILGKIKTDKLLSTFNTLVPSKMVNRRVREALVMSDESPIKISFMTSSIPSPQSKRKDNNMLTFGFINSSLKTNVSKALSAKIRNHPKYSPTKTGSERAKTLLISSVHAPSTTVAQISEREKEMQQKPVMSSYVSYFNLFLHPDKRRKQDSSSFLKPNERISKPVVEDFLYQPYQTYGTRNSNQNQSCRLNLGLVSFLRCKGSSAIKATLSGIQKVLEMFKKSFIMIKTIFKNLCDKCVKIYRWFLQKKQIVFEKVYKALRGIYTFDGNDNLTFDETQKENQSFVQTKRLVTRGIKSEIPVMGTNKSDEDGRHGLRNLIGWRNSENKNGIESSAAHFSDLNDNDPNAIQPPPNEPATEKKINELNYLGNSTPIKTGNSDTNSKQEHIAHRSRRSPQHLLKDVGKTAKDAEDLQETPGAEAQAMTNKLLKLMRMAKDYTDRHPVKVSSKNSNENYDFQIGTIKQGNQPEDLDIDLLTDEKPTEADRQLLENIERLTFSVIGRQAEDKLRESQKRPQYRIGAGKHPNMARGNGIVNKESHRKLPDERNKLKSTTSSTKRKHAPIFADQFRKNRRPSGFFDAGHKAKASIRDNRLSHGRVSIDRPNPARKSRYQRDVKAVQRLINKRSSTSFYDSHSPIFPEDHKVGNRKETKRFRSNSYAQTKTSSKQKRSLDTIDLMDDFRLLWPPLRAKAIDLTDKISNLKTTYDAAIDELTHLIQVGDDYNKDAKEVAQRDKIASVNLQKETEKLMKEETKFKNFQKQIANEEKLTMDFERKANELSKAPISVLFAARTLPESKVRVDLNEITLSEPVLSVPAPDTALQKLDLDYNNRAGLKSALLNLKPVHRLSQDENLHMLANDLAEITSRANLNMKGPARRRRSTFPSSINGEDRKDGHRKDEALLQNNLKRSAKKTNLHVKSLKSKQRPTKKANRGKRAVKLKEVNYQKPLIKCRIKQPKTPSKMAAVTLNDKDAAAKYYTLTLPKSKNQKDKSAVTEDKQKTIHYAIASEDTSKKSKPKIYIPQRVEIDNTLASEPKDKKYYKNVVYGQKLPKSLAENPKISETEEKMEVLKERPTQNFIKEQEKVIEEPRSMPKPNLDFQQKKRKNENMLLKDTEQKKKINKDATSGNNADFKAQQENIENQPEKRKEEQFNFENKQKFKKEQEKVDADNVEAIAKPKNKNQLEQIMFDDVYLKSQPQEKKQEPRIIKPEPQEKTVGSQSSKPDKPEEPNIKSKSKVNEEKKKEVETTKLDTKAAGDLKSKLKVNEADKIAEESVMKSEPKGAPQKDKDTESSNIKLDKKASELIGSQGQPKRENQQEKPIDKANGKPDKITAAEFDLLSQPKRKEQPQKNIDLVDDELDKIAAKELDIAIKSSPNNPPTVIKSEKTPNLMNSMELSLKAKPNEKNKQEGTDVLDADLKAPQSLPAKTEEISLPNRRRKRALREERMVIPLNRARRRVIDYNDASFVNEPDVGHVVVGFHGLNFHGDQQDVLSNVEEDIDEEDTLLDGGEYGGVDGDMEDLHGENLLDLDVESDYDDDCLDDYEDSMDYEDAEDDGLAGAKKLEDIAPAEMADWERAHAVKQWDDVGTDIQLYAAPDRDTPEEIMRYKDPVVEAQKAEMDMIGSGKDLANDLEAELMTPKKDPVIEGLMAPGIRQDEKDTINEARLLDTIPSLNTIEDVSGVLKAAGRDLQQELKMRDMGVDVDKLLNEDDLDPYSELMGDRISDDVNRKYIDFFGRTSLSGPVQAELRDIVNTRQKADRAFKTLRKSETLVDESILPKHTKTALDEQLIDSVESIRREQKKLNLQGKIFETEEQAGEADAIRDLEQNNESLIDQRMRQTEQLEEDLKAAASDQVEMAARRSKMLHDLALQAG